MATHTRGPWHAVKTPAGVGPDENQWFIVDRDDSLGHNVLYGLPAAELEANAHLAAAAPDLLEACRRLLTFNEELCLDVKVSTHYPSADFARKAIAKAEGRV